MLVKDCQPRLGHCFTTYPVLGCNYTTYPRQISILERYIVNLYYFIHAQWYINIDNNTLESIRHNNKTCNHNTIVNRPIGYKIIHQLVAVNSFNQIINLIKTQAINC